MKGKNMLLVNKLRIDAIKAGCDCIDQMHGSVIGDPSFNHVFPTIKCKCTYGTSLSMLKALMTDIRRMDKAYKKVYP